MPQPTAQGLAQSWALKVFDKHKTVVKRVWVGTTETVGSTGSSCTDWPWAVSEEQGGSDRGCQGHTLSARLGAAGGAPQALPVHSQVRVTAWQGLALRMDWRVRLAPL